MAQKKKISVIIPFYNGNEYIQRAINSISAAYDTIRDKAEIEVVIVNDSPGAEVKIANVSLEYQIIENEQNCGIHRSRIIGFQASTGDYIQFLDQDDELLAEGYVEQLRLLAGSDIVVGNGDYHMGEKSFSIYKSLSSMKYLVQLDRMLKIRNLIPSPGECLIKRAAIPNEWLENPLDTDGADDWMLWVIMLKKNSRFVFNPMKVYRHNDAGGENCSANLDKMRVSATEANERLQKLGVITTKEARNWEKAIEFKYLQDSGKLSTIDLYTYRREILNNVRYKIISNMV